MIESIHIANLGVIDHADIELGPGLTVLTGETGAGKTMVLTSLQWLTGKRADPALVRSGAKRAEVDGVFTHLGEPVVNLAAELGVDDGDQLILSRTVGGGRTRARVGSRPVPVATLAQFGDQLVTIHGQSDQLLLRHAWMQRQVLDSVGGSDHQDLLARFSEAFSEAVRAKRRADDAHRSAGERAEEIAQLRAVLDQLEQLNPYAGEEDDLLAATQRLTNIEDLRQMVTRAYGLLSGHDQAGAREMLQLGGEELERASHMDPQLGELAARLRASFIEVDDVASDVDHYLNQLQADPEKLAELHQRRAELRDIMTGRAATTAELMQWWADKRERLEELTAQESNPEVLDRQLRLAQERVMELGKALSASRQNLAGDLAQRVDAELAGLAMKDARFHVELEAHKPSSHGLEDVHFLLQPHQDAPSRPLGQGASGGELSRIMLALEVVLSTSRTALTTFVFDEVDAGIGGKTAVAVGERLARLASHQQVIVVTHLAQVAAFGTTHLVVEKAHGTATVRSVTGQQRVGEIARMMGGNASSDAARRHSEELLLNASVSQSNGGKNQSNWAVE